MWRWALAVALVCAALYDVNALKRAEMSASPFVLSSRYGRSSPRMLTPRNDRFFMSGRYGKRSDSLEDNEKIDLTIADIMSEGGRYREDGESGRDSDMGHKWKPRCDCPPYTKTIALRNFYKRKPETVDPNPNSEEE